MSTTTTPSLPEKPDSLTVSPKPTATTATDAAATAAPPDEAAATVTAAATADAMIDSALLAALREPRERLALLRLEQVLMDLIQSETDGWIEVGGPYNSMVLWASSSSNESAAVAAVPAAAGAFKQTTFQRCILHRLADRFGIVREPGSLLQIGHNLQQNNSKYNNTSNYSNPTGAIRLIKLPHSKIPAPLLQDLDPAVYNNQNNTLAVGVGGAVGELGDAAAATAPSPTTTPTAAAKPRKMKIMKRDTANNTNAAGNNSNRNHQSLSNNNATGRRSFSDKEKAYAEARARIFQDEAQDALEQEGSNFGLVAGNQMANLSLNGGTPASDVAAVTAPSSNRSNTSDSNQSSSYHRSSSPGSLGVASSGSYSNNNHLNNNYGPQRPETTNFELTATRNKAVYRNYAEEVADPDFRRHASRTATTSTTTTAAVPFCGMVPPQHHQHHPISYGVNAGWQQSATPSYAVHTTALPQQSPPYGVVMQQQQPWPPVSPTKNATKLAGSSVLTALAPAFYPEAATAAAAANHDANATTASRRTTLGTGNTNTTPVSLPASATASTASAPQQPTSRTTS